MNTIVSMDQVLGKMEERVTDEPCIVPIIVVRPEVLSLFSYEGNVYFQRMLNFYDFRTGEIPFFLPGYYHTAPGKLLINEGCRTRGEQAFYIDRVGSIFFSAERFAQCLSELEDKNNGYHYLGATELILVQFYPKTSSKAASLDYPNMEVYDLARLFVSGRNNNRGFYNVECFLGDVFRCIREKQPFDTLVQYLSDKYRMIVW